MIQFKVALAAGGRFHAFHLAHQLEKNNALARFYSAAYTNQDRHYISQNVVSNYDLCQKLEFIILRTGFLKLIQKSRWYIFKDNLFDNWLNKQLSNLDHVDIFVGWAHYFLRSMNTIRIKSKKIILESGSTHILYQSRLLEDEYKKFGINYKPVLKENIIKILNEYDCADYIMTPSEFVRQSFLEQGFNKEKILKIPYGVDLKKFSDKDKKIPEKFKVLFVGNISLQKGTYYLLEAWHKLNLPSQKAELILVGNMDVEFYKVGKHLLKKDNITLQKAVSQKDLSNIYSSSSVFALPSIQEGLAMVQAEAMASGLPIICSTNTGGADLIDDGKEGFIIPIRDSAQLAERINWLYKNKDMCKNMGAAAAIKAQQFSWDSYGQKILQKYKKVLGH